MSQKRCIYLTSSVGPRPNVPLTRGPSAIAEFLVSTSVYVSVCRSKLCRCSLDVMLCERVFLCRPNDARTIWIRPSECILLNNRYTIRASGRERERERESVYSALRRVLRGSLRTLEIAEIDSEFEGKEKTGVEFCGTDQSSSLSENNGIALLGGCGGIGDAEGQYRRR